MPTFSPENEHENDASKRDAKAKTKESGKNAVRASGIDVETREEREGGRR